MSEDDRAAKAARAKAMLKKRQQKKAAQPQSNGGKVSPGSPLSRAMSPALSHLPDDMLDAAELFPPSQTKEPELVIEESVPVQAQNAPPPSAISSTNRTIVESKPSIDLESVVRNQQQTISLLVAEKASLTESLMRLEGFDHKLQQTELQLAEESRKAKDLRAELAQITLEHKASHAKTDQLTEENDMLRVKMNEQERELQLSQASVGDMQAQVAERARRLRDLEEQIQNDDRAERLESSLKNTQDRADELEFQLTKLRQAHDQLKQERDNMSSELHIRTEGESEWKEKHASLQQDHTTGQQQLTSLVSERDSLLSTKSNLELTLDVTQRSLAEVQQKLAASASELAASSRQLDAAHTQMRSAEKRAEHAEKIQRDLQSEGTNLMHSLDEMRSKTMELTDVKLNMTEKVDKLVSELRERDSVILQLEGQLEQLQQSSSEAMQHLQELESDREEERLKAEEGLQELQRAYADLQNQLDDAMASVRELDSDRSRNRLAASRQQEELDHIRTLQQSQSDEISGLQAQLQERGDAGEDGNRVLGNLQSEVESLRAELSAKDDELTRLREVTSSIYSPSDPAPAGRQSLSDEMMNALKQQHELDISAAHSQIRGLESTLFETDALIHSLQRQVRTLQDELERVKLSPHPQRTFSPSSGFQRVKNVESNRRSPFADQKTHNVSIEPPTHVKIGRELTPATRHQRQVSLAMLQARMESEIQTAIHHKHMRRPSRPMTPLQPTESTPPSESLAPADDTITSVALAETEGFTRPQFLDESHVFWCSSCKGDLIVL